MDEYIKREDALDAVLFALSGTGYQSRAIYAIRELPTADVVLRSEGEWIKSEDWEYDFNCSVCGNTAHKGDYGNYDDLSKFCPNCGAKMKGGE